MQSSNNNLLVLMLLSTMLGSTNLNFIQILIEFAIFGYLIYKISVNGFKSSDIIIFILLTFSHLLSILNISVFTTILNLKMSLIFLLPIMFFNKYPVKNSKIFFYIFILNSIVIIFEYFRIYLYPFGILSSNTLVFIDSRPIGLFLNPHISSSYTALFTIYLILFRPKRKFLILLSIVVIFLNASWTALVALVMWILFYLLGRLRLLSFLNNSYNAIFLIIILSYSIVLNFDFFIEVLKQIPNSRWYSFELLGKVMFNPDYYISAIQLLPNDLYSVIKFQEEFLLLAVGNESALLKIIIENGLICGLILLFIGFKNLKHISIFFFITLLHYSAFMLSPFVLLLGLNINYNMTLKKSE